VDLSVDFSNGTNVLLNFGAQLEVTTTRHPLNKIPHTFDQTKRQTTPSSIWLQHLKIVVLIFQDITLRSVW